MTVGVLAGNSVVGGARVVVPWRAEVGGEARK